MSSSQRNNPNNNADPSSAAYDHDDANKTSSGGTNPFDFDVDFAQVQKRRERARAAKAKEEAEKALLTAVDADDPQDPMDTDSIGFHASTSAHHAPGRPKIVARSNIISANNNNDANAKNQQQPQNRLGFLAGFNKGKESQPMEYVPEEFVEISREPVIVGSKCLSVWPYDDYHLLQKLYYEKLEETTSGGGDHDARNNNNEKKETLESQQSSVPIFNRPPDPPEIPVAVQGLSLSEFERTAEERAISIVSTWLFDAGLIDELLVNGGMTTGAVRSSGASTDEKSVQTSEGVEVGHQGAPIEGSTKMDKEIAKLRNSTNRQLALINARLNDGVAATGSEVQELVNAVILTKDEIGRLRELSTYVSNAGDVDQANQFMLTKYPKLKQAINARRNLARCFRELDFFSQIPSTCDRLHEELTSCEWTAHEWSTLRSVCREHVELEIFMVEAEAGMKKRLEEEQADSSRRRRNRKEKSQLGKHSDAVMSNDNKDLIDRFLAEHVENVWELGDEIRVRIMSGIASAFDLAINNPAGMVALVEAVEVYQSANDDYKAVHGEEAGQSQNLRFTDMRAAALGELYKIFESRGLDIFREITMQAADVAEEGETSDKQFSAVLRAANELASEIGVVKEQMAPCFPPNWAIETLWTTCVAHVCSSNILQQIGGPEGHKLPDFTVTPLLDLVAWVENFREIIEETFPNIGTITSKRNYFDQPPKLLVDNNKTVDIEVAKDSLAWVNNTLWDVHDLAKDEFLFRTKEQTEEWLENVYRADHDKSETAEGRLVTSLCEDVYALAGVQLRTIRDRLTRKSEALVQAVGVILKNLYEKQMASRDLFCVDFETCCAASNDFIRMSEKCEEIVAEIQEESNLSPQATEVMEEQAAALLGLYSSDAVYAAQKTHVFCFEPIEEAIFEDLFSADWLNELTQNELALTLVRTLDDFMGDLASFLDEVMVQKSVEAQVTSAVNFYIRCLLTKASKHNSRSSYFSNNEKALLRMRGDINTIREYFVGLAEGGMPTLSRVIEKEFDVLEAVHEVLAIASGVSTSDVQDFITLLHSRVRTVEVTKFVVGDLYHLMKPSDEHTVYELIDSMEAQLKAIAPHDEKAFAMSNHRNTVPGLRLDHILTKHCTESTRKRPLKQGALDAADAQLKKWTMSFGAKAAEEVRLDDK